MTITVKLFAILKDEAGVAELSLNLPDQGTVDLALQRLSARWPAMDRHLLRVAFAVNLEYVRRDHRLSDGDELALIPPVSGG